MLNVHERTLAAPATDVGALLDGLASPSDPLWPRHLWPPMEFDRPLGVGAVGGHGPIRYTVESYTPGQQVLFRFTAPRGFHGTHGLQVHPLDAGHTLLKHVLEMRTTGFATVSWPLVFRPLHDALLENALDRAEDSLGLASSRSRWSLWVRVLRWTFARGRTRPRSAA